MKKNFILTILVCGLFSFLTSCDGNKRETEKIAREFADAINDKDLSVITTLYPRMIDMNVSHLLDSISYEKIDVTKSDSIYVAEYLPEGQKLYIQYIGKTPVIMESKGIMILNEMPLKLAKSVGVPFKKMSDYELEGMMNRSKFIAYLADTLVNSSASDKIRVENIRWIWSRSRGVNTCEIRPTIINNLDHRVNGDDYVVELKVYFGKNFSKSETYRLHGVDLLPNESYTYVKNEPYLYTYAKDHNLTVKGDVLPKDQSVAGLLMFFGDFKGTEFNDFLKKNPDVDIENPKTYLIKPQENNASE